MAACCAALVGCFIHNTKLFIEDERVDDGRDVLRFIIHYIIPFLLGAIGGGGDTVFEGDLMRLGLSKGAGRGCFCCY